MNANDARTIATQHREALHALLAGVFGDAATAEKFVRFTLQRLEVDFDEIEGDAASPRALFLLARETCREYVASATFARTPFAQGDDGLPLSGVLPADPAALVAALPRTAQLALRVMVVDGLGPEDVEALFCVSLPHLESFLERVGRALGQGGKLARLAPMLARPVRTTTTVAALPAKSPVDVTQPGTRYTPPSEDDTVVPGTSARPTVSRLVPRGGSLSPLVTGGHPASRSAHAPFTTPFPTRQVPVLEDAPASPAKHHALVAGALLFAVAAAFPLSGAYRTAGRDAGASAAGALSKATTVVAAVQAPVAGGIGTLELPGAAPSVLSAGQTVYAPVRGEARLILAGVDVWLAGGSRAVIEPGRLVLEDGVARIAVAAEPGAFIGVADPLELKLTAGTYVLRRGAKHGAALATINGIATAISDRARGLTVEAGRTLALSGAAGGVTVKDTPDLIDEGWGREGSRVARAAAASVRFSALPEMAAAETAAGGTGAGGRQLYVAAGSQGRIAIGSAGGVGRGAAAYKMAF